MHALTRLASSLLLAELSVAKAAVEPAAWYLHCTISLSAGVIGSSLWTHFFSEEAQAARAIIGMTNSKILPWDRILEVLDESETALDMVRIPCFISLMTKVRH